MRFLAVLALCLMTFTLPAHAAPPVCNAGSEGMILYNKDHKLVQFCNGTDWIGMSSAFGSGADTLSSLSCASGEVPEWDGTAWVCGAGGSGLWTDSGSGFLTYSAADTGVQVKAITGMAAPVSTLADLGCANSEILKWNGTAWACAADDAGALADDAVTNAKMADDAIGIAELSATGTPSATTYLRGDNTWATISTGLPALTSANIWVGNGSNVATAVAMSGDATISNAGVLTIGSNAVGSSEITNASVALADLSATGTASASTYLRGDNTWASVAGDNLGNHTATTNLGMGGFSLSNANLVTINHATDAYITLKETTTNDGFHIGTDTDWPGSFVFRVVDNSVTAGSPIASISQTGTITGTLFAGSGASLTSLNATNLASGTVATARLGSGTANTTTFLRGDSTWAAPSITETDPQVGTTTASNFCKANVGGTAIDCATAAIVSADITDSTIVSADIAADTIAAVDIATGGVATAEILDGTIALGDLSATGTASGTTFLRGDNTWAAPSFTETDPQVGITTASNFCKANVGGTAIDCATAAIISADITDSTIVSADIAADTIAAVDIATGGVATAEILDGTILTADLADDAVTIPKLAATGTADATTFLRGDNTWATPSGGGGAANYQSFTSSGTWTKPGTGTVAFVECWGGGGAGGRGNGSSVGGAGGGGGGYVSRLIPFTSLTATVAITIGAGGTATATNNTAGGNGGNTTFGSYLTAYGGAGGGPHNINGQGNGGGGGTPWAAGARPSTNPNADGAGGVCDVMGTSYPPRPGLYAGGGGGCISFAGTGSFYGGGGGGSWYTSAFAPGLSVHAGNGGAAASGSATAGSVPSGGGGGTVNGTSGAGGAGRCQVTAW